MELPDYLVAICYGLEVNSMPTVPLDVQTQPRARVPFGIMAVPLDAPCCPVTPLTFNQYHNVHTAQGVKHPARKFREN